MGKNTVQIETRSIQKTRQRDSLATLYTLALWRWRQIWWQFLLAGVALLAACTLACIPPLFSSVTQTAGLQELLNGSPDRTTFALKTSATSISSAMVPAALQKFDPVVRQGLGPYLDASPTVEVISVAKLVVIQPERLTHLTPLSVYATDLPDLRSALHLVQGRWANEQLTDGAFEIMLSDTTAQALDLTVGSTLTIQSNFTTSFVPTPASQFVARLVGIFANPAANVPALHGATLQPVIDYTGPNYTFLMSDKAFLQACDQIAAREGVPVAPSSETGNPFRLVWYYHLRTDQLRYEQIDDLISRLSTVQYKITSSLAGGSSDLPYLLTPEFLNPAPANADLLTLVSQYTSRIALINLPLALLALQIVALLIFFASLLVHQLVDRQMTMSALLNSRGASARQIFWSLNLQTLALCLSALLLAPWLGKLFVYSIAASLLPANEHVALSEISGPPGELLMSVAPYLLGAFLLGWLATSLPCRQATQINMLELRRERARTRQSPFWQRYYLDLLAALLALSSFGVALYLTQVARTLDLRVQELIIEPLTLITPLVLLLGGLLLFLRAFPWLLRLASRLARPARGASSLLALTQMARSPQQATRLIMLLALATAFASFSLVFSASQNQRALDIAAYESLADFSGSIPDSLLRQIQQQYSGASSPQRQVASLVQQEIIARYSAIPGVLSTSAGYASSGISHGLGDAQQFMEIRAVDLSSFAQTAIWTPQDSAVPLKTLLNGLGQDTGSISTGLIVPAIVDETTLANLHISLRGTFDITLDIGAIGHIPISFQTVAAVNHIPGVNGSAGVTDSSSSAGVLVDFQALNTVFLNYQTRLLEFPTEALQGLPTNQIWLRTGDSPQALTSVRSALTSSDLALNNLYDRRTISSDLQSDPLIYSMLVILEAGGIIALLLAFLGNLVTSWLHTRLRLSSFVVLRALGASRWQVISILLWEQGLIYLAALLLSLIFGAVLAWIVVPELVFTGLPPQGALSNLNASQFYLLQRVIPAQTVIPASLQLGIPVLILLYALALVFMARLVLQASYAQELRLNED